VTPTPTKVEDLLRAIVEVREQRLAGAKVSYPTDPDRENCLLLDVLNARLELARYLERK
jgi:hypothetical protein